MAKYLDEGGLTHFWAQVAQKIDAKADDDKYKIMVLRTKKQVADGTLYRQTSYKKWDITGYMIHLSEPNDFFEDSIPSGYFVKTILSAKRESYDNETDYNNSNWHNSYVMSSVQSSDSILQDVANRQQTIQDIALNDFTEYGFSYKVTVLLEKKGTPPVPQT